MVRRRDRAQLILIGAILVAAVIFGLSLLLNSLLFAGATGADEVQSAVAQTEDVEFEIQRSVRSLAVRVNHAGRNRTAAEVAADLEANVSDFARLYAESKTGAGSAVVSVAYENATSTVGYRIVQDHDDDFTDNDSPGLTDWYPVPDSGTCSSCEDTAVGWFTANVNVGNTSQGGVGNPEFSVLADNGSEHVRLTLTRDGGNLSVDPHTSWAGSLPEATCGASSGRTLVDLLGGTAYTGTCEFTGIGALSGTMSVRFEEPDAIEGKYSIVVNETYDRLGPSSDTYRPCPGRGPEEADPCVTRVIWSANLTTAVQNDRVVYENAYNVSVYGGVP
jgi:hypothetical protein